jgi:SAM-dependent methyltransferase
MFERFRQRSNKLEHLDVGDYTADEYERCISELQIVNKWMGDAWTLKKTLLRTIQANNLKHFSVLDVGAGSGELLRVVATWAREHSLSFTGVGLELNERSAASIKEESSGFPEIMAIRGDALRLPFSDRAFDFVISSLFTHHLTDDQIVKNLREMSRVAARSIFVIDLHRHPVAYLLYTTLGKIVLHTRLVREDGALSILRGFKPGELEQFALLAKLPKFSVTRYFPFRLVLSARTENSGAPRSLDGPTIETIDQAA